MQKGTQLSPGDVTTGVITKVIRLQLSVAVMRSTTYVRSTAIIRLYRKPMKNV